MFNQSTFPIAKYQTLSEQVGRALVGSLFAISGLLKITRFAAIAGAMGTKGIPFPDLAIWLVIGVEVLGGLALILGWRTRIAAIALALFVVMATLLFHPFWVADATTFQNQLNHFLKNVAIVGALLPIAWAPSRLARKAELGAVGGA